MSSKPSREISFTVLQYLYERSGNSASVAVKYWHEDNAGALTLEQTQSAITWLRDMRLLKLEPEVQVVSLTPLGVAAVERALGSPESATDFFPALASFFGLNDNETIGLCRTTVRVWLDQLDDCSHALALPAEAGNGLERCLSQLESCVSKSALDPKSLELGLLELRASL